MSDIIEYMWYLRIHVISWNASDIYMFAISLKLRGNHTSLSAQVASGHSFPKMHSKYLSHKRYYSWLTDMTCTLFLSSEHMTAYHVKVSSTDPWEPLPFWQHILWHQEMVTLGIKPGEEFDPTMRYKHILLTMDLWLIHVRLRHQRSRYWFRVPLVQSNCILSQKITIFK